MESRNHYLLEVRRGDVRLLAIIDDAQTDSYTPNGGDLVRIGYDTWEIAKVAKLFNCDSDVLDVTEHFTTKADAFYRAITPKEVA